jgi:prolyl oligopeptidase
MNLRHWLASLLLICSTVHAAPPVAEVQDVPAVHHGVTVPDPYRWMEDTQSAKAQAWMGAQGQATRALLDRIDQRAQIQARITELSRAGGDAVRSVTQMPGGRLFYLKRPAGENQFKLYTRQGLGGTERVVVDPGTETKKTGVPHAINHYQPSWDSRFVAYGMSAGGSENATLHVIDVTTGRAVTDPLPRAQQGGVSWLPDSRSLLVNQLKERRAGEPETETYLDSRVLWLRLADRGARPQPVFGPTVNPALKLDRLDVAEMITSPGSRWVVARTTDTTVPEGKIFVAPLAQLGRADTAWRQIGEPSDLMHSVALQGDRLYVMTRQQAPRRKVVAVDLRQGTLKNAADVVAEPSSGVLEWFMVTKGGLVVGHREGTAIKPLRHAAGSRVELPHAGAAWPTDLAAADSNEPLIWFSGWTEPGRFLRLRGARAEATALVQVPPQPPMDSLVIKDVEFASHDGVKVPMTLLHRRGLAQDGSNPVLLTGYASYGFSMTAVIHRCARPGSNGAVCWRL